ncbi:dephospho-CoA kinase [Pseudorhodoferax sp.]|uniref:dephospho-CoA kinase n=1 Tax=Pseudorhodoferax sp. TaxID=1993553 RepID=UPI002DD689FA|nr:dephospho-CoA kinase [Pseudorhodoferax sp.]
MRLGLTGGMASGKSTAARILQGLGARLIDTDAIARQLTGPGGAALPAIAAQFGADLVEDGAGLDRARLRERVFRHPELRRALEALLHPLIQQQAEVQAEVQAAVQADMQVDPCGPQSWLLFDVPLLVESRHWRARVQRVLLIDCDEAVQRQRALARGWSAAQVDGALAAQATRAQRRQAADAVIDNSALSLEALEMRLRALCRHWRLHPL